MPLEVTMPRLSDTMEEGTLLKWRTKVGDKVSPGDVLADVETDKATMELQSYEDGTIARLVAAEGATLPIGGLILVMAKPGETVEQAAAAPTAGSAGAKSQVAKAETKNAVAAGNGGAATATLETPAPTTRVRVSPLARKIAEEKGIDVAVIVGSGPAGRVIKRDVESAAAGAAGKPASKPAVPARAITPSTAIPTTAAKLEAKLVTLTNMRKTIARRLVESKQTIPHFTVTMTVNIEPLMQLRGTLNAQLESQGVKLSVNDFVVRAVAMALVQHPVVNSSWVEGGIQYHGTVNIGVAVALPEEKGGGLVVPTLRDAHNLGLRTISSETKRLAKKAREQGLTIEEMSDGTFTLSNLGMLGVEHFTAIINPPQAAILAIGAALEKPVVRDGKIVVGQEMSLTLSADHRVIDGATAAIFLQTIQKLLENPAAMLV